MFFGYLSSCGLSVTNSPLLSAVTIPNPPVNLSIVVVISEGFDIQWDPPSDTTDPLSADYNYVVKIINKETNEILEYVYNKRYPFYDN